MFQVADLEHIVIFHCCPIVTVGCLSDCISEIGWLMCWLCHRSDVLGDLDLLNRKVE
jgi:hypothetical protein